MPTKTTDYLSADPPISTTRRKAKPRKEVKEIKLPPPAERNIESAVPLTTWADDDIRRAQLVEVLNSPIMREALTTLRAAYESEIPSYVSGKSGAANIPNAADLNNLLALRSSHRAGFFGAFNALENLTREKVLRRSNMNPWGDLQPD
jgi:hypothetical protein